MIAVDTCSMASMRQCTKHRRSLLRCWWSKAWPQHLQTPQAYGIASSQQLATALGKLWLGVWPRLPAHCWVS